MTDASLLIGDIGGTNARFALANPTGGGFTNAMTLQCADFASAHDAVQHYLDGLSAERPSVVCLAVAGPIVDESVQVTNNHWTLSAGRLADEFGVNSIRLLNDFEALAYSIPVLESKDCVAVGFPEWNRLPEPDFNIAVIGPGTGLGAAGMIQRGEIRVPVVGEGGHIGFAPKSQIQVEILHALRSKFDCVSVERLVSGSGIENIYWALTQIHGEQRLQLSAEEIFAASKDDAEPRAIETTHMFFELLGQVVGDIALTLGALDGVFIAGGITKRYPEQLINSGFRNAFDNKGRYRSYMEQIPTSLITHDEPGLLGAAYCAVELSSS